VALDELHALVAAHVLDAEGVGVAAEFLLRDPQQWAQMVVEWGVSMAPVRATPEEAQTDAEGFRNAIVRLGYDEQRAAEVCAHGVYDKTNGLVGWQGGVNLTWFSFAEPHHETVTTNRSAPYLPG
jgi:hypothetical protein